MIHTVLPYVLILISVSNVIALIELRRRRKRIEWLTKLLVSRDAELGEMVTFKTENTRLRDLVTRQGHDLASLNGKVHLYERLHPALSPEVLKRYDRGELTYLVPNPLKDEKSKTT